MGRRGSMDTPMTVPMWVIPLDKIFELDCFLPHETVLARGDIMQWEPGMGEVVFFSHVWLSNTHPDPNGVQWNVIKAASRKLQAGHKIRVFWQQEFLYGAVSMSDELKTTKYAWIDYLSIPQAAEHREQQKQYIGAIYSFVKASTHFMVIAPPTEHREKETTYDYKVWGRRGWCRVEMFCNSVAKNGKVLVAESPSSFFIDMAGGRDALLRPPGKGEFTVDSDKDSLGPVLDQLVDDRIDSETAKGNLFQARLLRAGKHQVMAGLAQRPAPRLDLEAWLKQYDFSSPLEDEASGWTPFRYAVYEGRYDIAKSLLEAKADVEAPIKEAVHGVGYHGKDTTVLGALSFMRDDPDGIKFLVENRANVEHKADNDLRPLHLAAAVAGRMGNVKKLIELNADIHALNKFGDDIAGSAIFGGSKDVALYLVEQGSNTLTHTVHFGWQSAMAAIVCDGDNDTLEAVIKLKADVNWQCKPSPGFGKVATKACQAAYYFKWKDPSAVVALFSQTPGMTPLGCAAHNGNTRAVASLLAANADASLTNDYGRSPLHLATINGHSAVMAQLLNGAQPGLVDQKDCWGRTAIMWGQEFGHTEVVSMLISAGAATPPQAWTCCCATSGTTGEVHIPQTLSVIPSEG